MAANTARDVGGRLAAIVIWGRRASGGRYAAIAALTNILATVAAYAFYEFALKDSSRGTLYIVMISALLFLTIHAVVITAAEKEHLYGYVAQLEHRERSLDNMITRNLNGSDFENSIGGEHQEK